MLERPRRDLKPIRIVCALLLCLLGVSVAQESPPLTQSVAVPAGRQAENVAIVTVRGPIDRVTAQSVTRRIDAAVAAGADALVIEVDSPGGELGAVLEISNAIKLCPIDNTVAWINPTAYSGGAIIGLACRELVANERAAMGDALPIIPGITGIRGLSADERKKLLPPLLADVVESARRSGFDEYLVQAIVTDGIELWLVEDAAGNKYCIDENEYRNVFGREPTRGKPMLAGVGVTPEARNKSDDAAEAESSENTDEADSDEAVESSDLPNEAAEEPAETTPDPAPEFAGETPAEFFPASDSLADLSTSVSEGLETPSDRPIFDGSQAGQWRLVGYVCDGTGPIVVRGEELDFYGFSVATIRSDAELQSFFGATNMRRTNESWSERLVRFMTNPLVRVVLIAALIIGALLEMLSPGLIVPGTVAALALTGLVLPAMIIGMAGWWEVVAIVLGFILLAVELLALPGFGVFGLLGLAAIFFGIVGTFMPDPGSQRFPGLPMERSGGLYGSVVTLVAMLTAAAGMFFILRHMKSLPMLNRLVLVEGVSEDHAEFDEGPSVVVSSGVEIAIGDIGTTTTPLRPSGRADFDGTLVDVIAGLGMIESGVRVRVVGVDGMSVRVETTDDDGEAQA